MPNVNFGTSAEQGPCELTWGGTNCQHTHSGSASMLAYKSFDSAIDISPLYIFFKREKETQQINS